MDTLYTKKKHNKEQRGTKNLSHFLMQILQSAQPLQQPILTACFTQQGICPVSLTLTIRIATIVAPR